MQKTAQQHLHALNTAGQHAKISTSEICTSKTDCWNPAGESIVSAGGFQDRWCKNWENAAETVCVEIS
jgi:hypothetical protein